MLLLFFCDLLHTQRYIIILHNAPFNALSFVTTKIFINNCHFSLTMCQIEPIIHNNVYTPMCMSLSVVICINDPNWRCIFLNNTVNLQYYSTPIYPLASVKIALNDDLFLKYQGGVQQNSLHHAIQTYNDTHNTLNTLHISSYYDRDTFELLAKKNISNVSIFSSSPLTLSLTNLKLMFWNSTKLN